MRFDKSPSGANSISLSMGEAMGTRVYFDERIDHTGEINIVMSDDRFIELRDTLNRLYPPIVDAASLCMVKPPDEPGYYLTRQNRLLLKDEEGDWSARGLDGTPVDYFWEDEYAFTRDSTVIVSTLGVDAFPLIPVDVKRLSKAGD